MIPYALAFLLAFSAPARPSAPLRASSQVELTAQAMVAEAGWLARRDHIAIAHVLERRRLAAQVSFTTMLRRYCRAWRFPHARARWVRNLRADGRKPAGWPAHASWERHRPLWHAVLRTARQWSRLADPCRGRAMHWGGAMDSPHGRMARVSCGETLNTFYEVRR